MAEANVAENVDNSQDWGNEPLIPVHELGPEDIIIPPPVEEWCRCGHCHVWPSMEMNVCCKDHAIWNARSNDDINCITSCPHIEQLMQTAPLRMMWHNYCSYHRPTYPDAESLVEGPQCNAAEINRRQMSQKRLCAYRSLVFWACQGLSRGERVPLPSCVYLFVRMTFPSEDDEIWADYHHSVFAARAANDNN